MITLVPDASSAKGIRASVSAVIFDRRGRLLLQQRSDGGQWGLPGGSVEIGESVTDAVRREVNEETGLNVAVKRMVGVYSDPALQVVRYPDGTTMNQLDHWQASGLFAATQFESNRGGEASFSLDGAVKAVWLNGKVVKAATQFKAETKPGLAKGLNGAWLVVVGTQAVSVLASLLVPALTADAPDAPVFVALAFWLVGSMLYVWLIALIFLRILFLPLLPGDLNLAIRPRSRPAPIHRCRSDADRHRWRLDTGSRFHRSQD